MTNRKEQMTNTTTLIEALRTAGHEDQADHLRDTEFAKQLRDAGHDDVAAALEGKRAPATQPTAADQQHQAGQELVDELKTALNRNTTSLPGFLG